MLTIVDYGASNLRSVARAFASLDTRSRVVDDPSKIGDSAGIVLPGVGAFGDGITTLRERGFVEALYEAVQVRQTPFLGICLGMQFLAKKGFELGEFEGLGWIDATVERIQPSSPEFRIPHMGWNDIQEKEHDPMFKGLTPNPSFYFVHSFSLVVPSPLSTQWVNSTCAHGTSIVSSVRKDHIWGVQFHPEKSQHNGLTLLKNFIEFAEAR